MFLGRMRLARQVVGTFDIYTVLIGGAGESLSDDTVIRIPECFEFSKTSL